MPRGLIAIAIALLVPLLFSSSGCMESYRSAEESSEEEEEECIDACIEWAKECRIDQTSGVQRCHRVCRRLGRQCY